MVAACFNCRAEVAFTADMAAAGSALCASHGSGTAVRLGFIR
jgi:hypothetical protein